jgi:acetylornithine deacetylase
VSEKVTLPPPQSHDVSADPRRLSDDAIAILAKLISFDTTSSESNLSLIEYVEDYLGSFGVESTRIFNADATKANLLARIGPATPGGVVLSGHTDVVPVKGQSWTSDPFTLTRRGDRLYGRGTSDMKSFIALAMAIMPQLSEGALRRPIFFAFSYDEEVGCLGAPDLIDRLVSLADRPALAIVGEPTSMAIVDSHKGMSLFEIVIRGREAHSSMVHEGISANMVAIDVLAALAEIARREPEEQLDSRFDPPWSTLTVGTIVGGTAANILARDCRITFDLRHLPARDIDETLAPFWAAVEQARAVLKAEDEQADIHVTRLAAIPPLESVPDNPAEQLARSVGGSNVAASAVSYGAEAGQFQRAGLPTVICGPGSIVQAHRSDEFIDLEQIEAGARFMAKLIERLSA